MKRSPNPRVGAAALGGLAAALAVFSGIASARSAGPASVKEAPVSRSAPTIEGTFRVGRTVTASRGIWENTPTRYTYQWQRCDPNGNNCQKITNATRKQYRLRDDDVGQTVVVLVTAYNASGNNTANSKPSPQISGRSAANNTSPPTITGTPQVGQTLTATKGSWTGVVTGYQYQWQRCDNTGGNCANIIGATNDTYKLSSADAGNTVRVVVTAANASGSTSSTSVPTAVIQQPSGGGGGGGATGCANANGPVSISDVQLPVRLLIDRFAVDPNVLVRTTQTFTARIHVSDTCGRSVGGALVRATAVPFNQISLERAPTASDGWATLTFRMLRGFPANPGRQQILALYARAQDPNGSALAGVSTRRLLNVPVDLRR
jgi:hypothetical protein